MRAPSLGLGLGYKFLEQGQMWNTSWTVSDWYIDRVNGSDGATGTTIGAPLKTWKELLRRYGTLSPVLAQNTTYHFLSDDPDFTDPVMLLPIRTQASVVGIQGKLINAGVSGTLANVTAKNRSTPQLLNANLGSATAGLVGMIVENTTRSSRAFIDAVGGGGATYAVLTQPFGSVTTTLPTAPPLTPAEVDTWANTDAFVVKRPVNVNLALFIPYQNYDTDSGADFNFAFISQVNGLDPHGPDGSLFKVGSDVSVVESSFQRWYQSSEPGVVGGNCTNCWFNGSGVFSGLTINGGAINSALTFPSDLNHTSLDGDVIVRGICEAGTLSAQPSYCGLAYFDTTLLVRYGAAVRIGTFGYGSSNVWGPGVADVVAGGMIVYETSATSQLNLATLKLDGGTTGVKVVKATGVFTGGVTVNKANLDAADGKSIFNPQTGSLYAQYVS